VPIFSLDDEITFPPVDLSEPDGLLAIGGDLSPQRLITAYRNGIFPWYQGDDILWWCPDPRFVLLPGELKISKPVKKLLDNNELRFTMDQAFAAVIHHCKKIPRAGQDGTWITDEVEAAYCRMHELGYAHSAELWHDKELVGGLYGIRLGKVFFGESMFSKISNASRITFIKYVEQLRSEGVELIDCQIYTEYLESFGSKMIPRKQFISYLMKLV
jgi:leucyl/phenylalanyl-tRNA---protein transferase